MTNTQETVDRTELLRVVHLNVIEPNPWQPRSLMDKKSIKELMDSIESVGLLQEPMARHKGGKYQLAFGHSRIEALRGLHAQGKRHSRVNLKVAKLADEDMAYIALTENRVRKDLAPAEELAAWAKVLSEIEGVTIQSLADKVGVDRSTMSKNLSILALPAHVIDLVNEKVMSVRTARELLCLRDDAHSHWHTEVLDMALQGLAGGGGDYIADFRHIPDYRVKTARAELRAVCKGGGGRGVVFYHDEARNWRALEGREFNAVFDTEAFKKAYPESLHTMPEGDESGGQVWTCNAKAWSTWAGRATREANKGEAGSGPQAKEPAKRKKGETEDEAWFKVVKRDPVVRAHLGKRLSKVVTVEDLTKEDRDALGTRVELVKSETINLPAEAQPGGRFLTKEQEQYDKTSKPPLFDFSQCASCTVGATWEGGDHYRPGYRLVCSNQKQYNDRQAQGVQEWKRQLDAKREAEAEDDGRGIVKLSVVVLDAGEAEVLVKSMGDLMQHPRQVKPYPGGSWDRYDYWPLGAARFAQLVGVDLPEGSYNDWQGKQRWWDGVLKFFGGDLAGFDWRLALACLLVWQARVSHGTGARLWSVARATELQETAA